MFMWVFYASFCSFSYRGKVLAISLGLVTVSPFSRDSTVGTLDALVFREIRDLIPFHVFLTLF